MKLQKLNSVNAEVLSKEALKQVAGGQTADQGTPTGRGTVVLGGDSYLYSRDIAYENGGHHYFVETMMPGVS